MSANPKQQVVDLLKRTPTASSVSEYFATIAEAAIMTPKTLLATRLAATLIATSALTGL